MEMALAGSMKRAAIAAASIRRNTSSCSASATDCRMCLCRARLHRLGARRPLASFAADNVELSNETRWKFQGGLGREGTMLSARRQVRTHVLSSLRAIEVEGIHNAAVDETLQQIYAAMGLQDYCPGEHISLAGKTVTWGIPSDWNMKWCMDGRFYEKFSNHEVTQEWGHDGKQTWYADAAGRVARMEMDEGEVFLLTAWVRIGYWVTEEARRYLNIEQETQVPIAVRYAAGSELVFAVKFKNKEVVAHVVVNKNTWLPVRMSFQRYRQGREWEFSNWQQVLLNRSCQLPMLCIRSSSSALKENFRGVKVEVDTVENGSVYSSPDSLLRSRHNCRYPRAQYNKSCSPFIQMTKARTGHYVVRPLIDGREVGYFIVDTGTGGLAITSRKARQLGLSTFGEVYATSISGGHVMATRFSRGASFQIGPLKITDPIFIEIGIEKLLKDADGLCGYDIFHGSVVEMSHKDRTLSLYDPLEYEASSRARGLRWQRMYLFDRVPHILAKINGREVMLMLDTGAAGPGLMFPSSAVHGFDNQQADVPATLGRGRTLYVSQAEYGNVQDFEIAGCSFTDLTALVPNKTGQQMGLSGYSAGVVCAEMLKHFILVFDYNNRRMAFLDQRFKKSSSNC